MSLTKNASAHFSDPDSSVLTWATADAKISQRAMVSGLRRYLGRECLSYFWAGVVIAVLLMIAVKLALVNVVIEGVKIVYVPGVVTISLCISLLVFAIVVPAQYLRPVIAAGVTRRAAMVAFVQVALVAALSVGILTTVVALLPPSLRALGDPASAEAARILPPGMIDSQGVLDSPWGAGGAAVLYALAFMSAGVAITLGILRFGWIGGVVVALTAWLLVTPFMIPVMEAVFGPLSTPVVLGAYVLGLLALSGVSYLLLRNLPMRQPAAQS